MLLGNLHAGVPKLVRDHMQRHTAHREPTAVRMPQNVKADSRDDASGLARDAERAELLALGPGFAIRARQENSCPGLAERGLPEERRGFVRQHNRARRTPFALPYRQHAGVQINIGRPKLCKFLVAASGQQRGRHQRAQIGRTGVHQPRPLFVRQVSDAC